MLKQNAKHTAFYRTIFAVMNSHFALLFFFFFKKQDLIQRVLQCLSDKLYYGVKVNLSS